MSYLRQYKKFLRTEATLVRRFLLLNSRIKQNQHYSMDTYSCYIASNHSYNSV